MKRHLYVIPNDADLRKARIKERWLEAIILAVLALASYLAGLLANYPPGP